MGSGATFFPWAPDKTHRATRRVFPACRRITRNRLSLRELRIVQTIKPIVDVDLKWAVSGARLSHSFSKNRETQPMLVSRSSRSSDHCSSRMPGEDGLFPQEA